jgi:hypothetical protein
VSNDAKLALFLMLGQGAERTVEGLEGVAPSDSLLLSPSYDLAPLLPDVVKDAMRAAEAYKLLFVFEQYLRDLVVDVLSKDTTTTWWDKVPKDVQDQVTELEQTEEVKAWMAVGSRDKSALMTYPQLLRAMDHNWKGTFDLVVRDKTLINQARAVGHLRNTICHMTPIPEEETERVRQVMRDWFRLVAP